jgi:hypothetical protein
VGLEAVELDDEPLGGPAEVGLDRGVEVLVDERAWQVVGIEEGQEAAFAVVRGRGRDDASLVDEPSEVRGAGAPRVAVEELLQ